MSQKVTFEQQIGKIFSYMSGYTAIYVIDTGVKLGLFKSLKDGGEDGVTPVDLASAHELHAPYVETWCKTACALELLDRDDGARYRLAPFYESILASPGDPRYIGGMATLTVDFFHDDLSRYPEFFRTGSTNTFQEHGEELSACVMEVSGGLQTAVVHGLLPKLPEVGAKLKEGIRVLDMGCGGGGLMIRIAKVNPNCSCVGVDVDRHGIELARTNIAKAGLDDRVSASLMDGGEIDFADEFELVTMFEVLHEMPLEVRPQVLANCYKALKPGGRLFIVDETYPATVAESRDPSFRFSVLTGYNELVWGNVVPSRADQEKLLGDAGFEILHRDAMGGIFTIILAGKA